MSELKRIEEQKQKVDRNKKVVYNLLALEHFFLKSST